MSNNIHPTAIIDPRVDLGSGNEILPYTVIYGPTKIGDNNIIGPHAVIGSAGQNTREPRYDSSNCKVEIGSGNIIKEFSTVQKPVVSDKTYIGDETFLMHGTHIPHDAMIDDKVVITPFSVSGGHISILKGANIGMAAVVHQFTVIGQYAMVAANATVVKNIKPFVKYIPGKPLKVNDYNIDKYGFKEYTDEIYRYIQDNVQPTSDALLKLTDRFEKLHVESGRQLY